MIMIKSRHVQHSYDRLLLRGTSSYGLHQWERILRKDAIRALESSFRSMSSTSTRTNGGGGSSHPSYHPQWNLDNMKDHHVNFKQPEYYRTTMFDGKISVLLQQQQPLATSAATTTTTADAENTEETGQNSSTEDPAAAAAAATSSSSSLDETTTGGNTATMAGGDPPRTSVLMELTDRVGVLHDVLKYFWKYDVNICRIESRPTKTSSGSTTTKKKKFDFFVDIEGSVTENPNVQKLLDQLRLITDKILILDETKCVHWFPRHVSELDYIANRTLDAGTDLLAPDHPGFHDPIYRQRRAQLAHLASEHRYDRPIPHVSYTPEEISAWTAVWDRIQPLTHQYACQAYLTAFEQLQRHCGYARENIPQVADVSEYLTLRTGFRIRPVAGLLSSRDFLNGLAFRVFFSTQYIRHSASPLYTPEPDVCHELLGHAPMLANRDFADFSQEIGLASLGASDEDVDKLAHCYWHSVEFGLCKENGKPKAYGAGLLSSYGEMEYACGDHNAADGNPKPQILPWDPEVAARQEFPITTYQPIYFLAESLEDAKEKMRRLCEDLPRPFFAQHNPQTDTIYIDRPVKRTKGVPTSMLKNL